VAVNGAVEVDLTGQSCMALGERGAYLGALGQPHFNRIAQMSANGRAVIALRSTSRDGSLSRIVPRFTDSRMGVFTTQCDVEYVVTEHGGVRLFGKSIRERALELITIAHPKFRGWLLEEAKRLHHVYPDQVLPPSGAVYPAQYEHVRVFKGTEVFFRPVRITDERAVQNLFYSMSSDDRFHRFLIQVSSLHHSRAQRMVTCDYSDSMALVAEVGSVCGGELVAIAHICRDEDEEDGMSRVCEFAVMVHPDWQNTGLGTYLLGAMIEMAVCMGFTKFRANVCEDNVRMLRMLSNLNLPAHSSMDCRVVCMDLDLRVLPKAQERPEAGEKDDGPGAGDQEASRFSISIARA